MHRSLSTGNKACYQRAVDKNHARHLDRLQAIKKSSSQTFHLQNQNSKIIQAASSLRNNNRKKEVQKEVYSLKVERENRLLLDKMTDIVNNKSARATLSSFPSIVSNIDPKIKSLNENVRRQEIIKITSDNFGILNRIQRQSSVYDVQKWENDYKTRESYLRNLCEFPLMDSLQSSPIKSSRKTENSKGSRSARTSFIIKRSNTCRNSPDRSSTRRTLLSEDTEEETKGKAGRKITLHRKKVKIENDLYSIDFAISEEKFEITFTQTENKSNQYIRLEIDQGKQLLEQNNNNYEQIVSKIYFKNNKPQIKGFFEEYVKSNTKIELFESLPLTEDASKLNETPSPPEKVQKEEISVNRDNNSVKAIEHEQIKSVENENSLVNEQSMKIGLEGNK